MYLASFLQLKLKTQCNYSFFFLVEWYLRLLLHQLYLLVL